MRIVSVIGTFRPLVGGTETHAAAMGRLWAQWGHDVEIWTRRLDASHPRLEPEGAATIRRLGWATHSSSGLLNRVEKATFALALFRRLVQERPRPHVVIAHQTLYPALVAAVARRFNGRPLVLRNASTGVTSDYLAWGPFARPVLKALRSSADAVVVTNREGGREARAVGFEEARITRITNGLDPGSPSPLRPSDRRPKFAYVGGLRSEKRVDLLLRAWSRAQAPGDLVLAGDGSERSALETLARELGILVTFLGNVSDPRSLLGDSDVFVLASDAEGMSNALLEAMASSCACLATFVGGNIDCLAPEVEVRPRPGEIVRGSAGWLVACGDEPALAIALRTLADDRATRVSLGRAARLRVEAEYNILEVAAAYLDLFKRLSAA